MGPKCPTCRLPVGVKGMARRYREQRGRRCRRCGAVFRIYADEQTKSIQKFLAVSNYRRERQMKHNQEHGITPRSVQRPVEEGLSSAQIVRSRDEMVIKETGADFDVTETVRELEAEMLSAANNLEFEKAALLRDQVNELKRRFDAEGSTSEPVSYPKGRRKAKRAGRRT